MATTKLRAVLWVQSSQLRFASEFAKKCDMIQGDLFEEMVVTFSTTTEVDNAYITKIKEHMTDKDLGDMYCIGVKEISIIK